MIIRVVKRISPLIAGFGFLANATKAFAENINVNLGSTGVGIPAATGVGQIIANAVRIVFAIALIAVLAMLAWGAFEWIISGGEKEKVASARNRITHALIGLALLGLSFVIVTFVGKLVGINDVFNINIPTLAN